MSREEVNTWEEFKNKIKIPNDDWLVSAIRNLDKKKHKLKAKDSTIPPPILQKCENVLALANRNKSFAGVSIDEEQETHLLAGPVTSNMADAFTQHKDIGHN